MYVRSGLRSGLSEVINNWPNPIQEFCNARSCHTITIESACYLFFR